MDIYKFTAKITSFLQGVDSRAPQPTPVQVRHQESGTMGHLLTVVTKLANDTQQQANLSATNRNYLLGKATAFFQFVNYLETEATMGLVDLSGSVWQQWLIDYQDSLKQRHKESVDDEVELLTGRFEGENELLRLIDRVLADSKQ